MAVGDNVEISIDSDGQAIIETVLPRKQYLSRPDKITPERRQVIATNLDQLVVVTSASQPQFKSGLIDRFLVSAERENLPAAVVINKIDLKEPIYFTDYVESWRKAGYTVLFTSAKKRLGLDEFKKLLEKKSSVLTGHSGVGKSTLINSIQPQLDLKTKDVSRFTGKGVHTTTAVIMYPLDVEGWIVDTPGLKIFSLTDIEKNEMADYFPEIRELAPGCRFDDCNHISEPNCAVKQAVGEGRLFEGRYASYKKLWEQLAK